MSNISMILFYIVYIVQKLMRSKDKSKGVTQFCAAICVTPMKKLRYREKKSDFEACSKPPKKYYEKTKIGGSVEPPIFV